MTKDEQVAWFLSHGWTQMGNLFYKDEVQVNTPEKIKEIKAKIAEIEGGGQ